MFGGVSGSCWWFQSVGTSELFRNFGSEPQTRGVKIYHALGKLNSLILCSPCFGGNRDATIAHSSLHSPLYIILFFGLCYNVTKYIIYINNDIYIYIQYIALCTQSLWLVIPAGNLAYGERSENIADQAFFQKLMF